MPGLARLAGLFECHHVTPYRCGLELDRFVTMAIEDSVTELAAEKAQRLPQGPTGMRRVELGPKQRNDGIAAGTGSVNGEIGEKGEALRLSEDRVDRASVGPLQVQRPQHAQLEHAEIRRHRERLPTRESLSRASRPPLDLPPQFSHAATSARFTFNPKPVIMTPSSSRTITPTSLS